MNFHRNFQRSDDKMSRPRSSSRPDHADQHLDHSLPSGKAKHKLNISETHSSDLESTPTKKANLITLRRTKCNKSATPASNKETVTPSTAERLGLPPSVAKKIQKHVSSIPNLMYMIINFSTKTLRRQALLTEEESAEVLLNYFKNIVTLPFALQ